VVDARELEEHVADGEQCGAEDEVCGSALDEDHGGHREYDEAGVYSEPELASTGAVGALTHDGGEYRDQTPSDEEGHADEACVLSFGRFQQRILGVEYAA